MLNHANLCTPVHNYGTECSVDSLVVSLRLVCMASGHSLMQAPAT
jgi:hypothetical protein